MNCFKELIHNKDNEKKPNQNHQTVSIKRNNLEIEEKKVTAKTSNKILKKKSQLPIKKFSTCINKSISF